jgi:hypothetical protein
VVDVVVILMGSDSCGDVGFGKEMAKFSDVFANAFWTARSDVSKLRGELVVEDFYGRVQGVRDEPIFRDGWSKNGG